MVTNFDAAPMDTSLKLSFGRHVPELLRGELLRLVTFPVLGIFQLLPFWQNFSTVAYKKIVYIVSKF